VSKIDRNPQLHPSLLLSCLLLGFESQKEKDRERDSQKEKKGKENKKGKETHRTQSKGAHDRAERNVQTPPAVV
jgi:hypothetical protein